MRPLRSWFAGVVVIACAMISARRAAADGFDAAHKPGIPVSFFSHQGGWIEFLYPPSARERVGPLFAQADNVRAALGAVPGSPPLDGGGGAVAASVPAAVLIGAIAVRLVRRRKARHLAASTRAESAAPASDQKRVHIVVTRREEHAEAPVIPEAEVPRVEHEGEWHTLH